MMLSIAPKNISRREEPAPESSVPPLDPFEGEEKPVAPRHPAAAVPSISGVRFSPGGYDATLVNISETGALTETGERIKVGGLVTLNFQGGFTPQAVEGRVVRTSVAALAHDGRLRYHVGIAFTAPIRLEIGEAPMEAPQSDAAVVPPRPLVQNRW